MGTSWARCARGAVAGLAIALWSAAAPAASNQLVGVDEVRFAWAAATGRPTGYLVYVSRNQGGWKIFNLVAGPEATIPVSPGETLAIAVRAVGRDATGATIVGPMSLASQSIEILAAPRLPVDGEWTLHCPSCPALEFRALADGALLDGAEGLPEPWTPVARVSLAPGADRIVWQDPTTGRIELWDAAAIAPVAGGSAQLAPGARVVGAADFDGDAANELVVHDPAARRVELWDMRYGSLQRVYAMDAPTDATLASAADFDGDGAPDLVWRTPYQVRLWTFTNLSSGGLLRLALRVDRAVLSVAPGVEVVGVADYDGRGTRDLLLRDGGGALTLATFYGAALFQVAALPTASGDHRLRVAGSLDLDGVAGDEIVLQHLDTGAVQSLDPGAGVRRPLLSPGAGRRVVDVRGLAAMF